MLHREDHWMVRYLLASTGLAFVGSLLVFAQPSFKEDPRAIAQVASAGLTALVQLTADQRPPVPALEETPCFDTEHGWIYASDRGQAESIAEDLRFAADSFYTHFGEVPPHGAICAVPSVSAEAFNQLRTAGAQWVMPWFTDDGGFGPGAGQESDAAQSNGVDRAAIRAQIVEQLKAQGVPETQIDAIAEKALSQALAQAEQKKGATGATGEKHQRTKISRGGRPLRHELGHTFYIATLWPSDTAKAAACDSAGKAGELVRTVGHYGGGAPDWLDETAAVLMEDETLTASRRAAFSAAVKAQDSGLKPLAEFFAMKHPGLDTPMIRKAIEDERAAALKAAKAASADDPDGAAKKAAGGSHLIRIQVGDGEADQSLRSAAMYYTQCRGVIDYMIDTTANPRVFRDITGALKEGGTMDQWLATEGAKQGLPGSVTELDARWREWAKSRMD